ncbi:hypothetical protein C0995_015271 [Termitomyces sp. Mi166|nr:hypothetical protein C0995_015271 [Termitomyces sp. Mi166\
MVQGSSTPVGRSRHGKRLPHDHDDDDNYGDSSGSVTSPTATVTVTVTLPVSTITAISSGAYSSGGTANNMASSSMNTGKEYAAQTTAPGTSDISSPPPPPPSSGTPVGVVVSIVLAVILLLAAGGVVWFRRRSIVSRLKKRQWTKQQQTAPSFLFVGHKGSIKVPQFSVTSSNTLQPYRGGDPAAFVNMTFAGPGGVTQTMDNGLPYIPHPAPPRPPPAAGMYDTHTIPNTPVSMSPSAHVLPLPATPSLAPSLSPPKQAETAKVRATFIPTLPDELTISSGEMVRIHMEYDDGWGLCSNARGETGMVPLECLDKASQLPQEKPANNQYRRSVRVSSLVATPKSSYGGNTPKSPYGGSTPKSLMGEFGSSKYFSYHSLAWGLPGVGHNW